MSNLTQLADYTAPAYFIDTVDLSFDLEPNKTKVLNRMSVRRNPALAPQPLRLDGEELTLARVLVNGQGASFKLDKASEPGSVAEQLVLDNLPDAFELEIFTTCAPAKNTKLMGLYVSDGAFFTQCEAEGFRRITYFLDRPDVMATFSVTLRASKSDYPVLLSNGNLVEQGALDAGRHFAKWIDPHKKPCYLFALVAGRLVSREQRIASRSGQEHLLQIYVRPGDLDKTEHAMHSLMASVAWDETRFGLPLDLERFMIVAVGDFNMGAMENKGLNIFNTKLLLANPATATDVDYANIEAVVGHEYFHNWTGNRITCRDWFQLSLKEGLTVFRDQEFSQDMSGSATAAAVKRIEDVRALRAVQFSEDAGPMAHPVRPDQYQEISNFYTATVYEKGAEVVRMMQTLVATDADPQGKAGFARGMTEYFKRHDGQAVTCDDFAAAIVAANPASALALQLPAFKRWYTQAGTPRVQAVGSFDAETQRYSLQLSQSCPATPGQSADEKLPFIIPIQLALLDTAGNTLAAPRLHVMTTATDTLVFEGVTCAAGAVPVPSLLRGFSAPVVLHMDHSDDQLLSLLAFDSDSFNQWEAAQTLGLRRVLARMSALPTSAAIAPLDQAYVSALRSVLQHPKLDAGFKELVLTLPSEAYIAEQLDALDPQAVHTVREALRLNLAQALHSEWAACFAAHSHTGAYVPDARSSGQRALAHLALSQLCLAAQVSGDTLWPGKALQRFKDAANMTDRFGALSALVSSRHALAEPALARFYEQFKNEPLVVDKWFALQAAAPETGRVDRPLSAANAANASGAVLPKVRQLMAHPDFSLRNPNRARSLIGTYCQANPAGFHRPDAAGYVFWSERVLELDAINPQVAARLARALDRWRKLAEPYRSAACEAIGRVAAKTSLSKDVREVVTRALAD
jgi:aminopeptidase N